MTSLLLLIYASIYEDKIGLPEYANMHSSKFINTGVVLILFDAILIYIVIGIIST
jgi:hypothetical protein